MFSTERDEAMFPFIRRGTPEASIIGSWARAAFLPPETFRALLESLTCEWLETGADPNEAADAEAAALAAYRGEETQAGTAGRARRERHCYATPTGPP
jgi:hypothetical protein